MKKNRAEKKMKKTTRSFKLSWLIITLLIVSPYMELTRVMFSFSSTDVLKGATDLEVLSRLIPDMIQLKLFFILFGIGWCTLAYSRKLLSQYEEEISESLGVMFILQVYIATSFIITCFVISTLFVIAQHYPFITVISALLLVTCSISLCFYLKINGSTKEEVINEH